MIYKMSKKKYAIACIAITSYFVFSSYSKELVNDKVFFLDLTIIASMKFFWNSKIKEAFLFFYSK